MEATNQLSELIETGDLQKVVAHIDSLRQLTSKKREEFLNSSDNQKPFFETPLHRACFAGHIGIVRYLLEMNSDPFSTTSIINSTPLHSAAASGQTEIMRILLNSETEETPAPVNHQTSTGWTPLHCALARGHFETAKVLVGRGARLDIPNNSGKTCRETYESLLHQEIQQLSKLNINTPIQLNGVTIQIASDLHLEFYNDKPIDYKEIITPSAPILALLGDIGIPDDTTIYKDFLLHMAGQFQLVLVIAGNHEYYHCAKFNIGVKEAKAEIQRICDLHPNLVLMDKTSILVNGVRILGATLWSYIPLVGREICGYSLNDYRRIGVRDESGEIAPLTPEISSKWFEEEFEWIKQECQKSVERGEQSIVVLTHHTPSFFRTSAPMFTTHPWNSYCNHDDKMDKRWVNCCFSSDLEEFAFGPLSTVKVWAYGHTHFNHDQIIGQSRLVSNQRGYLGATSRSYSNRFSFHVSA